MHYLLSVNWRTRKTYCIIQSKFKNWGPTTLIYERDKMDLPAPEKRTKICLSFAFLLYWSLDGLDDPCSHGWGQPCLFNLPIQMLIFSRDTLTERGRNKVYLLSGHPIVQSSWHMKVNIVVKVFIFIFLGKIIYENLIRIW